MASIPDRVTRLETIVEGIGENINQIRTDIRDLRTRIDNLDNKISSNLKWVIGTMVVLVAPLYLLIINLTIRTGG